MKFRCFLTTSLIVGIASAADLYEADFSMAGVGSTHDTGADALEASPIEGENWSIFWTIDPATDGSTNRFITEDGLLIGDDWGGEASFETDEIDVSGEDTINIEALAATRGVDVFNAGSESFNWYYILDGVQVAGTSFFADGRLDYSEEVDVSGVSTLRVGFFFNINGAGDGFEIVSVKVNDGVPTPEISLTLDPTTFSENGETSTVTVTLTTPPDGNLVLDLVADDLTEVSLPDTVTVNNGTFTGTFQLTGVDDFDSDGPQIVNLTVTDPSGVYKEAVTTFVVSDNEAFTPPNVSLNEIRINSSSAFTGDGEYFELRSPQSNASLDRVFLVAIGDGTADQGSGVVEEVIDLTGESMNGNLFVASDPDANAATDPDLSVSLNFEDDNVTFLLVSDFAAVLGDDLDADDDGMLDSTPWGTLLDSVSLVSSIAPSDPNDLVYAETLTPPGPVVGPDATFIPAHVYLSTVAGAGWQIGKFFGDDPDLADTPGAENPGDGNPPVDTDLRVLGFETDLDLGRADLTVSGLGDKIWILQSSDDLGQFDTWETFSGGFSEIDNDDGSTTIRFFDTFSLNPKRFYRLIEQP